MCIKIKVYTKCNAKISSQRKQIYDFKTVNKIL